MLSLLDGSESAMPPSVQQNLVWCGGQLSDSQLQFLRDLSTDCRLELDDFGDVLFCHATPGSDSEIFTKKSSSQRLELIFRNTDAQIVVCGHTHMQFDIRSDNVRILNAGSVGMPFGQPGAYWLMFDSAVCFQLTDYDLASAAEPVKQTDYPEANEFADKHIMNPTSESEMLAIFEGAS